MRDGVSSRLGFSIDISGAKVRGRVVSKVMMIHTYYVDSHSAFIGPCNQAQYPWPLPFSCCWMRCRSAALLLLLGHSGTASRVPPLLFCSTFPTFLPLNGARFRLQLTECRGDPKDPSPWP